MAISLTESARGRIRGYLDADPAAIGLRFGVSRTGCSGWGYKVDMAREAGAGDFVFRNPNVAGECGCGESFTTDAGKAA